MTKQLCYYWHPKLHTLLICQYPMFWDSLKDFGGIVSELLVVWNLTGFLEWGLLEWAWRLKYFWSEAKFLEHLHFLLYVLFHWEQKGIDEGELGRNMYGSHYVLTYYWNWCNWEAVREVWMIVFWLLLLYVLLICFLLNCVTKNKQKSSYLFRNMHKRYS